MKVFIILGCFLSSLARASLEPVGYSRSGVSNPESIYSRPSVPDNSYVPSSFRESTGVGYNSLESGFDSRLSSRFALPSQSAPVSFNRHSSASKSDVNSSPAPHYLSANSFDATLPEPASDYLPPRENQHRIAPSKAYLTPNVQYDQSSDEFSSGFPTSRHYATASSNNRLNKINHGNSPHDSSRRGHKQSSDSNEYHYNAPENQEPAKYDFEYKVKDDSGNDFAHKESRVGESTQGVYSVLLADGRTQIVHYEADSHGYRPTITYEDTRASSGYDSQRYQY